jgi:trehalose synthase
VVIDGNADFFAVTKRVHNRLHGQPGDGGRLGNAEHEVYAEVAARAAAELLEMAQPGDVVLLHDPQTAGMAAAVAARGCGVVWRCHVGVDVGNPHSDEAWSFLRGYLDAADHLVFSREAYVPSWASNRPVSVIAPAIDPFSAKNIEMDAPAAVSILATVGILDGPTDAAPAYRRSDGSVAEVKRPADVIGAGPLPKPADRLVVQVSRWDRLKDMAGVLRGFADHVVGRSEVDTGQGTVRLVLVGPDVSGVSDDPEGQQVLAECRKIFDDLPAEARAAVNLVSLPMDDVDENAAVVNAVQRHATVVVQKSLAEGFGLTVAEAMWKARPMVASAVGGIRDQLVDGECGVLLDDPTDLAAFGAALRRLLGNPDGAARCGAAARERVREEFLPDRALIQWAHVLAAVGGSSRH